MNKGDLTIVVVVVVAAIAAVIVGGFLLAYLVGRVIFPRHRGRAVGLGAIGAVAGSLAVLATLAPDVWSPPPRIRIEVPAGFNQPDAILLEDARSENRLVWRGVEMPFFGLSTTATVPANGVLRVRSFGPLAGRGDVDIVWSDGARTVGLASGPGPSASNASAYLIYRRESTFAVENDETRERHIRMREEGR